MSSTRIKNFLDQILSKSKNSGKSFVDFVSQLYSSTQIDECSDLVYYASTAEELYDFISNLDEESGKIDFSSVFKNYSGTAEEYTVIKILNKDKPFLVDSFTEEIKASGLNIYKRINAVISVERDNEGNLVEVKECLHENKGESLIYFLVDYLPAERLQSFKEQLKKVLNLIFSVVSDWKEMISHIEARRKEIIESEAVRLREEVISFLDWIKQSNFVFIGYSEYYLQDEMLVKQCGSALGVYKVEGDLGGSSNVKEYDTHLYVGRSRYVSRVHRRVNADCIRIKKLSSDGSLIGEYRFLGLFTSMAHYQDVNLIPILRKKVEKVHQMTGFPKGGHNYKALISIIQGLPKSELFYTESAELYKTCIGMLALSVKPEVKLFVRTDLVGMFVSLVVFIPEEQFSMKLRYKISNFLTRTFSGVLSNEYLIIGESGLVRLQLVVKVESFETSCSYQEIEKTISLMVRDWDDVLASSIKSRCIIREKKLQYLSYIGQFPESYKEVFDDSACYTDIEKISMLSRENKMVVDLQEDVSGYHLKIFFYKGALELHQIIPVVENMSMKVMSHNCYKLRSSEKVMIHYFSLQSSAELLFSFQNFKGTFEVALVKALKGEIENDKYNALVLLAALGWREVILLRTFGGYLKQISFKYTPDYIQAALSNKPEAAVFIVKLFHTLFSDSFEEDEKNEKVEIITGKLEKIISSISNVVYDQIIRALLELTLSILRTNYYLNKEYISIKIRSAGITDMPLPKPFVEVFVYHNKFEAIHLRGGKVARGGIRWSDRMQDFRTEVLGLMKAQMPKNTAIVPVGSKGGFVVKEEVADKSKLSEIAISHYQNFLRGILDLTDNISNGQCVKPEGIVTYDEGDTYLVVAADKGTATFSNYANEISLEYNFWLGDAFASGGSCGYDHKKLAITARGAWISKEIAFWEKFGAEEKSEFTVVGIGDMSGDVFGNGMLLSDKIKLVAAFNHLHIFIDPNPDLHSSFAERKRLFEMPQSAWTDYSIELISKGGGVFLRSGNKSISLTTEMKELFEICEDHITPEELIQCILKADVDLMWIGGIGTYIKSSTESHESVGDRANDLLRVEGKSVKAKVIVEGGNLGCTQLGRIEYAQNGGLINTDFIDNCAGVSCSDIEVNIKIALARAIKERKISVCERDKLLEEMEQEVVSLILCNINKEQSLMMTMESMRSVKQLERYQQLIKRLVKIGLLDVKVEFLPSGQEIKKLLSTGKTLERPQIAILAAYSKMHIYEQMLHSDLPDNKILEHHLFSYFPSLMRDKFSNEILSHQLRREIISTRITNIIVNRLGCTFVHDIANNTGFSIGDVIKAIVTVFELYDLYSLFKELDELVGCISVDVFYKISVIIGQFMSQTVYWLLTKYPQPLVIQDVLRDFKDVINIMQEKLHEVLDSNSLKQYKDSMSEMESIGIPTKIRGRIVGLDFSRSILNILQATHTAQLNNSKRMSYSVLAQIYFEVGSVLSLSSLREVMMMHCSQSSYWKRMSIHCLSDEVFDEQLAIAVVIASQVEEESNYMVTFQKWLTDHFEKIEGYKKLCDDVISSGELDVSKFMILVKRLKSILAQSGSLECC